jgi:hypothetical protein
MPTGSASDLEWGIIMGEAMHGARSTMFDNLPVSRPPPSPRFTLKQGQYLAFIHAYTLVLSRRPAVADLRCNFCVAPPSVRKMVLTLECAGLNHRQPGVARSIKVLVEPEILPSLSPKPRATDQILGAEVLDATDAADGEKWEHLAAARSRAPGAKPALDRDRPPRAGGRATARPALRPCRGDANAVRQTGPAPAGLFFERL